MLINYDAYNEASLLYEYENFRVLNFSSRKSSSDSFDVFARFNLINIDMMNSFKSYSFSSSFNYFNSVNLITKVKIKMTNIFYKKESKLSKRLHIKEKSS